MILTISAIGMIIAFSFYLFQNRKSLEFIFSETIVTAIGAGIMWPIYLVMEIREAIRWGR